MKFVRRSRSLRKPNREETPDGFLSRLASEAQPTVLPIDEPDKEKQLLEQHGIEDWYKYLRDKTGAFANYATPEEDRQRICNIYKLCFEQSPDKKKQKIISDFGAHFPQLILSCPWLADLVRSHKADPRHRYVSIVIEGAALGLRRAAQSTPQERRAEKRTRLVIARGCQRELRRDLKTFVDNQKGVTEEWAEEHLSEKMKDLKKRFPELSLVSDKIADHLRHGLAYKASIIAAAAIYDMRERDLEGKP
jgi:hypothetical protein